MKALCYTEIGGALELMDVPAPACPDDGVVLDVVATGVCRSDWHAWKGHDPVVLPHIPGHEYSGVIAAVGPSVTRWKVGDRVTAPFVLGCGQCEYCRAGDAQVCPDQEQPGFTRPGSFAQQLALPRADTNLVHVPDEVDLIAAASLGCRFATAFRALTAHGRVHRGQWVAVHGCGGVGLSLVMIAVALGARVIAVDVSPAALAAAAELGAEAGVNASEVADTAAAVFELTGGGAHVSVDAIGHPATVAASVASLRRRGRHVQVGLLLAEKAMTAVPFDLVISRELEIFGSHGMAVGDYPEMLAAVADGRLHPRQLVGEVVAFEQATGVLAAMDRPGGAGMTVIRI
ncbi:alcohol dehydrogenase [Nakamurella panacisegetis]|uniref:Alcohol dehydrogenase n=1 Tax=Nakamurella panacisegetis TaxID=1090615 RepID=A0A1H0M923_9ACTN|nr:zinc-dependent alcohol dehydrogenase family protein [Nakamurella panacisegetis]SDO76620.1 alcohol dehydrogenase [Nakamurella panacisegetis]